MTTRERAADRILKVWRHGRDIGDTAANAIDLEFATDFVDAVLEEIREPGEAIIDAGHASGEWGPGTSLTGDDASAEICWRAMIDAIRRGEG